MNISIPNYLEVKDLPLPGQGMHRGAQLGKLNVPLDFITPGFENCHAFWLVSHGVFVET